MDPHHTKDQSEGRGTRSSSIPDLSTAEPQSAASTRAVLSDLAGPGRSPQGEQIARAHLQGTDSGGNLHGPIFGPLRVISYASTAIVAWASMAVVTDAAFGFNAFKLLRDIPALAVVGTAAHTWVAFIAASAGIGLARHRDAVRSQNLIIKRAVAELDAHEEIIAGIQSSNSAAIAHSQQLVLLASKIQKEMGGLAKLGLQREQRHEIGALCRLVVQVGTAVSLLQAQRLRTSLDMKSSNTIATKALERLPEQASILGRRIGLVTTSLAAVESRDTNVSTQLLADLRRLCLAGQELVDTIVGNKHIATKEGAGLKVSLDIPSLLGNLARLDIHATLYHEAEGDLRRLNPKAEISSGRSESEAVLSGIDEIVRRVSIDGLQPEPRMFSGLLERAKRLQKSSSILSASDKVFIDSAVSELSLLTTESPEGVLVNALLRTRDVFSGVLQKLRTGSPLEEPQGINRASAAGDISAYATRHPLLSIKASVTGLVVACSYWMCCQEWLEGMLPSGGNLYDQLGIGAERIKYAAPFALWAGIVLAAGALNHHYRPAFARASLELSELNFALAAPAAYLYKSLHDLVAKAADRVHALLERRHSVR